MVFISIHGYSVAFLICAMVGSMPHTVAYGMHRVVPKGIPHDYVICVLARGSIISPEKHYVQLKYQ